MSVHVNEIKYCYDCPWVKKEVEYRCKYYGIRIDKPLATISQKRPKQCKVTEIITVEGVTR